MATGVDGPELVTANQEPAATTVAPNKPFANLLYMHHWKNDSMRRSKRVLINILISRPKTHAHTHTHAKHANKHALQTIAILSDDSMSMKKHEQPNTKI